MSRLSIGLTRLSVVVVILLAAGCRASRELPAREQSTGYEDLLTLFSSWRAFQQPRLVEGVPDYTAAAMAAQHRELSAYQESLAAIDPGGWPVPQQVDYYVVRAEMNGLDFDHRVLRPWANNPAFYVTVFPDESDQPAREGPFAHGAVELWKHQFPLSPQAVEEIGPGIRAIPGLLDQARTNLIGSGKDLWINGTSSMRQQSEDLATLAARLDETSAGLRADVERAKAATDAFATWLAQETRSKAGPSGIGIEHYDWYLQNVQLAPYTWHDEVLLMERELARSRAFLALEESRNTALPELVPVASPEEHARRFDAAVTEYMAFLRDREILAVKSYMEPALRARVGRFAPGPREFFTEVDYRDPVIMRTHGYHWFDKAQMVHEPPASPVRKGALLYNMFITRTEGLATAWEEMMLQAGMFDTRPRSRELIYILVAQRAARALGDLRMHSNQLTLEQAAAFAAANTPRDWLSLNGNLVRGEQHLYLQQPAYGTSYLIGKMEIEKLLAERRRQLGDAFTMTQFMAEVTAAGFVPAALLRWELTGELPDDVRRMLDAR